MGLFCSMAKRDFNLLVLRFLLYYNEYKKYGKDCI